MTQPSDEFWMREALLEARKCRRASPDAPVALTDDVPVGAICVWNHTIIGRGHNRRELDLDPLAHAEVLALQSAAQTLNRHHLEGVTLYVSLEPCPMCAGALWLSRVSRLVFGAWDDKAGACGSVFDIVRDPRLNHRVAVRGGVLEADCAALLREFFAARR